VGENAIDKASILYAASSLAISRTFNKPCTRDSRRDSDFFTGCRHRSQQVYLCDIRYNRTRSISFITSRLTRPCAFQKAFCPAGQKNHCVAIYFPRAIVNSTPICPDAPITSIFSFTIIQSKIMNQGNGQLMFDKKFDLPILPYATISTDLFRHQPTIK
jgi:hypothetical protein